MQIPSTTSSTLIQYAHYNLSPSHSPSCLFFPMPGSEPSPRLRPSPTPMLLLLLLLFVTPIPLHHAAATPNSDMIALLSFKAASDPSNRLSTWNPTSDFCTWFGVSCAALNDQRRVSRLVLDGLNLTGTLLPLSPLTHLRVLSLNRNLLSGPLPDLFSSSFPSLKLLFLSHNSFSGGFPPSLTSLFRLYRLDLSHNNLSGPVPATLNRLYHLLTLRLEENRFVGSISGINLPNLQDLNISGNLFAGVVPAGLSAFPPSAFDHNLALCGSPLPVCKSIVSDPSRPGSGLGPDAATAIAASPANATAVVPSTPTLPSDHPHRGGKLNRLAVVLIVLGDVVVLAAISGFLVWYFWRASAAKGGGKRSRLQEGEKIVYSSSPYPPQGGLVERGKMVFFRGMKQFELEDLLRASAEMLGKGVFGTAYKAVLEDGSVVAVKRLKDLQPVTKREFEQQMDVLGRLRHPNLVPLMAYYHARDEKLLVYEYMANGSLFSLLHGNRGPGRTPLDWTTRMKIAAGAARGLAFIHQSVASNKLYHGNMKSTNILIDLVGNARLSDFGLSAFASTSTASRNNGYRAPELSDGRKNSHKADVFAFGVVLLEILTGKSPAAPETGSGVVDLPRWVQSVVREEWTAEVFDLELMRYKDIEEEMVGMLQIALVCTSASPDQRPRIGQVVKMIEEIRGEVSPSHESFDSVSESPAVSDNASGISH